MLNQVVIVGRITAIPILNENGCILSIATPRSFRNEEEEYETDFIPVKIGSNIAETVCEYCEEGDLVGIKGRIQGDGNCIEIIANKVTYLSTRKDNIAKNNNEE